MGPRSRKRAGNNKGISERCGAGHGRKMSSQFQAWLRANCTSLHQINIPYPLYISSAAKAVTSIQEVPLFWANQSFSPRINPYYCSKSNPLVCHCASRRNECRTRTRVHLIFIAANAETPRMQMEMPRAIDTMVSQPDWSCQPSGFSSLLMSKNREVPATSQC
jgi:hypothetical protein